MFSIKTTTELFHAKPLLRETSHEHFGIQNGTWHDNHELGVVSRRLDGFAGPSTLSRRLPDFYEYMYTAQSGGGFVFISPGDTSAAAPLHLFHLRRLRLALQVRSHHASMLPRHQSAAKRAQALPLLHPSLSTGNFHQFPVFSSSSFPQIFVLSFLPVVLRCCEGWDRCKHCSRNSFEPHTVSEQVCFWTGGVRQVLDEAAAHECSCQNVYVSSPVMTC